MLKASLIRKRHELKLGAELCHIYATARHVICLHSIKYVIELQIKYVFLIFTVKIQQIN